MVIVDNAVYSFGFQLDNGVPIIPFYDNKKDEELHHLIFYMKCLSTMADMRDQNKQAFQLSILDHDYIDSYLEEYYQQMGDNENPEEAELESGEEEDSLDQDPEESKEKWVVKQQEQFEVIDEVRSSREMDDDILKSTFDSKRVDLSSKKFQEDDLIEFGTMNS